MPTALLCLLFIPFTVLANTEKVVFLSPDQLTFVNREDDSTFQPSCVQDTLSPSKRQLHTQLQVAFPSEEDPRGSENYYLLNGLEPGRRYEVRVCWSATVCF